MPGVLWAALVVGAAVTIGFAMISGMSSTLLHSVMTARPPSHQSGPLGDDHPLRTPDRDLDLGGHRERTVLDRQHAFFSESRPMFGKNSWDVP